MNAKYIRQKTTVDGVGLLCLKVSALSFIKLISVYEDIKTCSTGGTGA